MPTTRPLRRALFAALLMLTTGGVLKAQMPAPGTRVRVKSSQIVAPVIGSLQGINRDTLLVIEDGTAAQVWRFTVPSIDRLEISDGMRAGNRGPTARWALIGAGAGAALGVLTAALLEAGSSSNYNEVLSGVVGAGLGALGGGFYGYRVVQERWIPVSLGRGVGLAPSRSGVRLGFSARF